MPEILNGEKLEAKSVITPPKTPVQHRKKNSSLLLDSAETVKVSKFCLDEPAEKLEYEKILNNAAFQIFRDEFVYDKLGHPQIVIWYYDTSS